jgi:small subunit ribosomal protein S18
MAHQASVEEHEIKQFIDYKDTAYLKQFVNPHGRILARRRTNIPATRQREIAQAIKRARFMALLPFIQR